VPEPVPPLELADPVLERVVEPLVESGWLDDALLLPSPDEIDPAGPPSDDADADADADAVSTARVSPRSPQANPNPIVLAASVFPGPSMTFERSTAHACGSG
jgi:hypothetical protein